MRKNDAHKSTRVLPANKNIGPQGVQEAIYTWGVTRNTFIAVACIATEARNRREGSIVTLDQ